MNNLFLSYINMIEIIIMVITAIIIINYKNYNKEHFYVERNFPYVPIYPYSYLEGPESLHKIYIDQRSEKYKKYNQLYDYTLPKVHYGPIYPMIPDKYSSYSNYKPIRIR